MFLVPKSVKDLAKKRQIYEEVAENPMVCWGERPIY